MQVSERWYHKQERGGTSSFGVKTPYRAQPLQVESVNRGFASLSASFSMDIVSYISKNLSLIEMYLCFGLFIYRYTGFDIDSIHEPSSQ